MKKIKIITSLVCVFAMIVSYTVVSAAVPAEGCSYMSSLDAREFAPPVETTGIEDSCLYYSILSTAGSYAKKYFNAYDEEADFKEENLVDNAGNPDVHNFGDVLYKSIGCNIGNGYAITSVEFLADRGERYLKEKISENGAIVVAIAVPNKDGLTNAVYYNDEESSFAYTKPDKENDRYHAVSIVGWDDDYDRAKFNKDENGKSIGISNGAWICKNAYGTDFGDGGYFYLSYTTPLLYSAALEVSQIKGSNLTLTSNRLIKHLGVIYGVNVRAFSSAVEEITVKVGKSTAFQGQVNLKNGCNLIVFDHPVPSNTVRITGNGISTASDTIYCYTSLLPMKNKITVKSAIQDENWIEDVESIYISVKNGAELCDTDDLKHIIKKSSIDNCFYLIPADGYRFTQDTVIKNILGFDNNDLKKLYPDDYKAFKRSSTIEDAVNADYKRLKDGDGNFKKMIEFDPTWDNGRGMLKIVGQGIGSAYVNELNILTDESGAIKNTILTFDDGSTLSVPAEITLFKDESLNEPINNIDGLEEYIANVKISGYFSENLIVKINGIETEFSVDENEIDVTVKIPIPDITQTIPEMIRTLKLFFAQLLDIFR